MKKNETFKFVLLAFFVSMIILQSFVPFLGNIPLVFLDITIIHITVIIGGILLGEKVGTILGFVWGVSSLTRAFTSGSAFSLLVFTNPIIAIIPRVLVGYLAAKTFKVVANTRLGKQVGMSLAGVVGSLTNTILVLSSIYFLIGNEFAAFAKQSIDAVPGILMSIVATNGIPEAIASGILTPIVGTILLKLLDKKLAR